MEAPGGALIALNCPDEALLGTHLPFPVDSGARSLLLVGVCCSPTALVCLVVQVAPLPRVSWEIR